MKEDDLQEVFKRCFSIPKLFETRKFSLSGIFVLCFCSQNAISEQGTWSNIWNEMVSFCSTGTGTASAMDTESVGKISKLRDFEK